MSEEKRVKLKKNRAVRFILIIAGSICVVTGFIGIFVPLLPATDFFLLAAMCYAGGSEKFYNWLIYNRLFGKYIRNYREGKGLSLISKIFTICFLWISITYSAVFAVNNIYVKILLFCIAIGVTLHLIIIKTARD